MDEDKRVNFSRTYGGKKTSSSKARESNCSPPASNGISLKQFLNKKDIEANELLSSLELRERQMAQILSCYCHMLSAVKYRIEASILYIDSKPRQAIDILYPGIQLIQDAVIEMDDFIVKLYPIDMKKHGFVRSVGTLVENFGSTNTKIHFTSNLLHNENRIPKYLQVNIYLAARGLLDYIFQTSESEYVSIELNESTRHIEFTIEEESAGSNYAKEYDEVQLESANSLEMARVRISLSEGSLDIEGALGSGRHVSARWPCDINRDGSDAHQ